MKSIAVFCASSSGVNPIHLETAYQLGKYLAQHQYTLIYGGASVGCMGALAKGAMENRGKVIGVLPHFLNKREVAATHVSELIMVESMHERKLKMHELSDGIITLPGGYGTMEELFEMMTWGQLGLHQKPMAILNTNGFYTPLLNQLKLMQQEEMVQSRFVEMLIVSEKISQLLESMEKYTAPEAIELLQTKTT
ncbi:TIGR00730 family Rossman fold protein [bacterium]|nr:TIGR00730 family Rossman fold protein [bacterium]